MFWRLAISLLTVASSLQALVLEDLSKYCLETTGYKVDFSFKPMEQHYEVTEKEFDFSDYNFEELDEYSQKYCYSLVGESSEETY